MRRTTVEYACDSCGKTVESQSDLQRFAITRVTWGGRRDATVSADFCSDCESGFLAAVEPYYPAEQIPHLHAMSRKEEN